MVENDCTTVDSNDAPPYCKAVRSTQGCFGCVKEDYYFGYPCEFIWRCKPEYRKDGQQVIFERV